MIGRFLCRIGWHDWLTEGEYYWLFKPRRVAGMCYRCGAIHGGPQTGSEP